MSLHRPPIARVILCILFIAIAVFANDWHVIAAPVPGTQLTVADARQFIDAAEVRLLDLWIKDQRANWVYDNFITEDTEQMAADADEAVAQPPAPRHPCRALQ